MMKCLIICACEKVIIDKTNGANSLISVMKGAEAKVTVPTESEAKNIPASELPTNAVAPNLWYVYTMWETRQEDVGKEFKQITQIHWPNGDLFATSRLSFTADETLHMQNSNGFLGFPIGQIGKIKISSWVEQNGNASSDVAHYEVNVRHALTP
jgi:hypothetical protein